MRKLWVSLAASVVLLGGGVTGLLYWTPRPAIRPEAGLSPGGAKVRTDGLIGEAGGEHAPARTTVPASEAAPPESPAEEALHGKVSDPSGEGIAGARVMVIAAGVLENLEREAGAQERLYRERFLGKVAELCGRRVVVQTLTDEAGLYSIPLAAIPPGSYLVLARHPDHFPDHKSWTRKPEATEMNFQLGPGEFISGTVLEQGGTPIKEAQVEALREESESWGLQGAHGLVDLAATEGDGRFQLAVPPGTFLLAIEAQGFLSEQVRSVDSGTEGLEIVLRPSANLSVKVLLERQPVEGARLGLFALPREGWWQDQPERAVKLLQSPQARGETGTGGDFVFGGVPSEHYYLSVEKPGLVTEWRQDDLEGGVTTSIEIDMRPAAVLTAVIKDPDGAPIAGAFVAIGKDRSSKAEARRQWRESQRQPGRGENAAAQAEEGGEEEEPPPEPLSPWHAEVGGETDGEGRFTFDTLPRGLYSLSVEADDFVPNRQDGFRLEDRTELEITLSRGIRLEGAVLSSTGGAAVPDARLNVRASDSDYRQVKTDAGGRYAIAGLSPGKIKEIQLEARGYCIASIKDLRIAPSPTVQRSEFTLDPAAAIGGTVIDAHGAAVSDAQVRVASYSGRAPARAERRILGPGSVQTSTDDAGRFAISEVKAGSPVELTVQHPAFKEFRSDPLTVEPGSRLENLRLQLSTGARMVAWVRDPDGLPVPGAQVRIEPQVPAEEQAGRGGDSRSQRRLRRVSRASGPDGKVLFSGIDGGEYLLTCAASGFQPHAARVNAVEDQELAVAIDLLPEMAIRGLVTDTFGMPVARAYVGAWREREGLPSEWFSTWSRGNGAFRLGNLGTGTYSLTVSCEGFAESRLPAVEAGTSVTIALARVGSIAGRVLAAGTGLPVARYKLQLIPQGAPGEPARSGELSPGARSGSEWRTFEDTTGAFRLRKIAPGSYIVRAVASEISGGEARVTVEEGQVVEGLVILLEDGLSIRGAAVRQGTSEPIPGAEVFLIPLSRPEEGAQKDSAAEKRRESRPLGGAQAGEPHPQSEGDPAQQESEIARKLYRLALEREAPVPTDESGAFHLHYVAPGGYELVIYHEAFVPFRQHLEIRSDGATPDILALLDPGETLRGQIRLADGSAAAAVMVRLRDELGIKKRAFTDAAGRYTFSGLVPGTYKLTVEQGQESLAGSQALVIEANRENRFDCKLAPAEAKVQSGR